jgi:hypothetical protein
LLLPLGGVSGLPLAPAAAEPAAVTLAGYQAQALAAGARFQFNSPGFLPLGDPAVGTVFESELPFARTTVDPGPVIDALGSPLYPGDTVAHLGSVLSTFGAPGVPNEPVLAESQYPPAPGFKTSASFGNPIAAARSATAQSTAGEQGADASSSITAVGLPGVFNVGASNVSNTAKIGQTSIDSRAFTSLGPINIAGLIQIDGIEAVASATSDGTTGKPSASLRIGRVAVAGQAAFIDQDGVHLASSTLGSGISTAVSSLLTKSLTGLGISVKTVSTTVQHDGPAASADSGALEITMTQHTPGILNVAGIPIIKLPSPLPTIGPGIPPLTEQVVVLLGEAHAAVSSSLAPSLGAFVPSPSPGSPGDSAWPATTPTTTDTLSPGGPGASAPAALAVAATTPSGGSSTPPQVASGPPIRAARSGVILGVPPGVAQLLLAVVAVIGGAMLLLAYARWQLLTGRSKVR